MNDAKWIQREVANAVRTLRQHAESRAIRDANGRVTHEGSPTPKAVEDVMTYLLKRAQKRWSKEADRG